MKKKKLLFAGAIALLLLSFFRHSPTNETANSLSIGPVSPSDQSNLTGSWFHASPYTEFVDERPQVSDLREAPERTQNIHLPIFADDHNSNTDPGKDCGYKMLEVGAQPVDLPGAAGQQGKGSKPSPISNEGTGAKGEHRSSLRERLLRKMIIQEAVQGASL